MNRRRFLTGAGALAGGNLLGAPQGRPLPPMWDGSSQRTARSSVSVSAPADSKVKITNLKTFGIRVPGAPGDSYVVVKLETDAGLAGWGEGVSAGNAGAVMGFVHDFHELLTGADPLPVERHWQAMAAHRVAGAGSILYSAISAIDQALWDLRGKILGLPVYQLLGGPSDPEGVRVYLTAETQNVEDLQRLREAAGRCGIAAFKCSLPGCYERIETNEEITAAVRHVELLRSALGPDIDLAVDFQAKTNPTTAAAVIRELDPLELLWVEEPCPAENAWALGRIAKRVRTPIAAGKYVAAGSGIREILEQGMAGIVQAAAHHAGGISGMWKAAAMAELFSVALAPCGSKGPIGMLASLHVDAAIPNFLIQECCGDTGLEGRDRVWEERFGFPAPRIVDGKYPLPQRPGLGFDLTEDALRRLE